MRIPSLLIAFAVAGSTLSAHDETDTNSYWPDYLRFGIGAVFTPNATGVPGGDIGFDPGFSGGLALGWTTPLSDRTAFDFEVEALYQAFTVDETDLPAIPSAIDDDAKSFAFMFNGILDWHFTPQFAAFGGLGVGYATVIEYSAWDSGNLVTNDDAGAAFQARFGVDYNLGGSYDVLLGYRYFKTVPIEVEDLVTGSTDDIDVAQHSIELSFRWGL